MVCGTVKLNMPLRACALTLSTFEFVLKSVQTYISMQIRIEMCVCTLLNANPMVERVRAHALKGKKNHLLLINYSYCVIS
jgi:hypothetical protein